MRLKHVSAELIALAAVVEGDPDLVEVAARMRHLAKNEIPRRKAKARAVNKSKTVTPQIRRLVWGLHLGDPDLSFQEIAVRVGVNAGRVSEIISGKRT